MKLLVGLGNPGDEYARHRHNVGFMAVEAIAREQRFGPWKRKFQARCADGSLGDEKALILEPQTYMNESGRAVGEAMRFLKIDPADVIVFHDELDLAPGRLKAKVGGGNAGHNGLRSISAHIGNDFARVRIGIGHPGSKDAVSPFVLHDFSRVEREWLEPLLDAIAVAAPRLAKPDLARFQSDIARRLGEDEPAAKPARAEPTAKPAPARHPAGEGQSKRQSAIAENLKKWLAARGKDD
jgi:peptidyl-tRNA hydrolase, PTH1 family